jgi:hypothetical protein
MYNNNLLFTIEKLLRRREIIQWGNTRNRQPEHGKIFTERKNTQNIPHKLTRLDSFIFRVNENFNERIK